MIPPQQMPVNQPYIEIIGAVTGKHLNPAGQCTLRIRVGKHYHRGRGVETTFVHSLIKKAQNSVVFFLTA